MTMRRKSVLLISAADWGGAASIARQDARALADLGLTVGYVPGDDRLPAHETIRQHWLPFISASSLVERLLRLTLGQITALLGLFFLVKKYHYQAIINHVPHIGKVCHAACRICGIPNIQVIHLPLSGFKAKKWMMSGDFNLSISERGKKDLVENWGVDEKSVCVLPPSIQVNEVSEDEISHNCKKYDIPPGRRAVACVALFNAQKNHVLLVRIWEKVLKQEPGAILLLAGEGPLLGAIKKMVQDRNLTKSVRFLGLVAPGWVYERSSFCILTSKDEGIPLVLLEAAAHKRAFLALDTGANREFIRSDWNGILVPVENEQLLVDSVVWLLQQPQKCDEMGAHAFERYIDFALPVKRGEKILKVLEETIHKK